MRAKDWRSRKKTSSSDRKSTRLNSSHSQISYAVFCLKKKTKDPITRYLDADALAPQTFRLLLSKRIGTDEAGDILILSDPPAATLTRGDPQPLCQASA